MTVLVASTENHLIAITCTISFNNGSSCNEVSLVEDGINSWLVYVTLSDHVSPRQHYQTHILFGNSAGTLGINETSTISFS